MGTGRQKAFESIIKGIPIPQSSVPESFNVLVKELNALGLAVEYLGKESTDAIPMIDSTI